MRNNLALFFNSPAKNAREFTKGSGRLANTFRKRLFCRKTPGMAEDFHSFSKHESEKKRNLLASFYLAQEIRCLKVSLKDCAKEEKPGLQKRLYQAHWNLAAVNFTRCTKVAFLKAARHCTEAEKMLPLPGSTTYPETTEASSLLHETAAKAQYLYAILQLKDAYIKESNEGICKIACKNMQTALDKMLEIGRIPPEKLARIGQLYFWLGELNFETEGYYSVKIYYARAMECLSARDGYFELAKDRYWDIESNEQRAIEVHRHNEKIKNRYDRTSDVVDPWMPQTYKWWDKENPGHWTSTDPFLRTPCLPEPKYDDKKIELLIQCPIAPKW